MTQASGEARADERTLALLDLPARADDYAAFADYALLGDRHTAALAFHGPIFGCCYGLATAAG